jgi:hypothetical protein
MDYLTIPDYDEFNDIDNDILSNMIAFEIDNENNDVINALKEIIYGDNNTALFSSTMIQGIFKSHNKEMYKIMGELLISARLQEGLRNSIVNEIADGTIESFMYMLKIIIDNNFEISISVKSFR